MSYDRALTVFSPDGHLFQVEYAMEAVHRGTLAVAIKCPTAIIIAVEKKSVPDLQDTRPVKKICQLDHHLLCTFAGLNADARVLINKARVECQNHRLNYEDAPAVDFIARHVASIQQKYTQKGGVRPFGVCTMIAGIDRSTSSNSETAASKGEPRLFLTEPSGVYSEWYANAIGRNSKSVKDFLESQYAANKEEDLKEAYLKLTPEQSINLAVKALLEVVQSGSQFVEVAVMDLDSKVTWLDDQQIKSLINSIEQERLQAQAETQT